MDINRGSKKDNKSIRLSRKLKWTTEDMKNHNDDLKVSENYESSVSNNTRNQSKGSTRKPSWVSSKRLSVKGSRQLRPSSDTKLQFLDWLADGQFGDTISEVSEYSSPEDSLVKLKYRQPRAAFFFLRYGNGRQKMLNSLCKRRTLMEFVQKLLKSDGYNSTVEALDFCDLEGNILNIDQLDMDQDLDDTIEPRCIVIPCLIQRDRTYHLLKSVVPILFEKDELYSSIYTGLRALVVAHNNERIEIAKHDKHNKKRNSKKLQLANLQFV